MATKRQILAMKKALIKSCLENKDDYKTFNIYELTDDLRESILQSLPGMTWEQTSETLNNLEHSTVLSSGVEENFYGTYGINANIADFPEYYDAKAIEENEDEMELTSEGYENLDDGSYSEIEDELEEKEEDQEEESFDQNDNIEDEEDFDPHSIEELGEDRWNAILRDYVANNILNEIQYENNATFESELELQCRLITENIKKDPQSKPSFADVYFWNKTEYEVRREEEREKIENMPPVKDEGLLARYEGYTDEQCKDFIVAYTWMLKRVKPGVIIETSELEKKNPKIKLRNLYDDLRYELDRKFEKGEDVQEIGRLLDNEPEMLKEYRNYLQKAKDQLLITGSEYDFFEFNKVDEKHDKDEKTYEFLKEEGFKVTKPEFTDDELVDEYIQFAKDEIAKRSDEAIIAWYDRFVVGDLVDLDGQKIEVVKENQEPEIQNEQQEENPEDEKEFPDDLSELSDDDLDDDLEGFLNEKSAEKKQTEKTVEENKSAEIERDLIEAYSRFLREATDAEKTIARENNNPDSYENLDLDLRLLEDLDDFRGYAENYTDLINALDINVPKWLNEYEISDMDKRVLGWYITNVKYASKDENKEKEPEIIEEENIPVEQPLDPEEIEYETNKVLEEFRKLNQKPEEKTEPKPEADDDDSEENTDEEQEDEEELQKDDENKAEKYAPDLGVIEEVPEEYDEEKPELEVITEVSEEYLDDEDLKQEEEQKQLAEKERQQKEEEDRKYDEESRRMEEEYQKGRKQISGKEVPLSDLFGEDEEEPVEQEEPKQEESKIEEPKITEPKIEENRLVRYNNIMEKFEKDTSIGEIDVEELAKGINPENLFKPDFNKSPDSNIITEVEVSKDFIQEVFNPAKPEEKTVEIEEKKIPEVVEAVNEEIKQEETKEIPEIAKQEVKEVNKAIPEIPKKDEPIKKEEIPEKPKQEEKKEEIPELKVEAPEKKEQEIKQEEKQPEIIQEEEQPEINENLEQNEDEEEIVYEFDEDEYEREVLQEQLDEQDRIEREQREREQQIPVNNNPQPVENIVNEENIIQNQPEIPQVNVNNNPQPVDNIVNEENNIQNQPEIPQVPENNNVLDENNLQPAENEHPQRKINVKSYSKALNELKKDLNSTLSIFSRDSDEFKDMMNYMNSFGNFEEYDEATRHDIIETLSTKVTAYMDHTKAKPIDNWRRNTRIDVFKKIGEVVGKYREGIQNPKEEYYAMATQSLIGVAHKAMPNKDHNELTRRLIASPTYKKLFAGMSMYQLDKVAYDEKAAADVLKQIAAGDKKLNAQKVQRHEEEELYIPEKVNNKTL